MYYDCRSRGHANSCFDYLSIVAISEVITAGVSHTCPVPAGSPIRKVMDFQPCEEPSDRRLRLMRRSTFVYLVPHKSTMDIISYASLH